MTEWPETGPRTHDTCPAVLKAAAARGNLEVDVTLRKPDNRGPLQPQGYECPHGTLYWIMPTEDQLLGWALDSQDPR